MLTTSDAAKGLADSPSGLLRLVVSRTAVHLILEPFLASFYKAYPAVTVEIAASEELIDLADLSVLAPGVAVAEAGLIA